VSSVISTTDGRGGVATIPAARRIAPSMAGFYVATVPHAARLRRSGRGVQGEEALDLEEELLRGPDVVDLLAEQPPVREPWVYQP